MRLAINAACQGSTTEVVVATQLERLNKSIAVVTITAGGNNLDTTGLLAVCTAPGQEAACLQGLQARSIALAEAQTGSGPLFQGLVTMINAVKAKAPDARVYVTGYPLLFHSPEPGSLQEAVNGLTTGAQCRDRTGSRCRRPGGGHSTWTSPEPSWATGLAPPIRGSTTTRLCRGRITSTRTRPGTGPTTQPSPRAGAYSILVLPSAASRA